MHLQLKKSYDNLLFSRNFLKPNRSKQPVSILLTAPSDVEFPKSSLDFASDQVFSDPSLIKSTNSTQIQPRRASDDCRFYSNKLQVVHVTDNPFLQYRDASDGVLALREDRERQRRHSIEPRRNSKILK